MIASYDADWLVAQYNPRASVANFADFVEQWQSSSAATRVECACELDISYGASDAEKLDVFHSSTPNAPIHIFFHGGYWRSMDKAAFSFIGRPFIEAGAIAIIPNYALCPAVTVDEIVRQCRAAIDWSFRHAHSIGGDPERIHISGHSAGGHIVGMSVTKPGSKIAGMVKGATAISGLFDLEPLRQSFLNADLHLDPEAAERNSPVHFVRPSKTPLLLSVGALESAEFHRQTEIFANAWAKSGNALEIVPAAGRHHYSVLDDIVSPEAPLHKAMLGQMSLL